MHHTVRKAGQTQLSREERKGIHLLTSFTTKLGYVILGQQKEKLNWLKQHHNTQDRNALSVETPQRRHVGKGLELKYNIVRTARKCSVVS